MRICIAITDDVFDTGLATLLDTFETANDLAGETRFIVSVVSPRAAGHAHSGFAVHTHHGFAVRTARPPVRAPDLVLVPALACKLPATIVGALERTDVRALIELVAKYARRCRVAAACTGTFVLGKAGVLDGRRATTTWWLGPTFRAQFPAALLDESEMIVADKGVLTAGAALAHLDLALAVIRERSPDLASLVARYLVLDDRPSQAPFIAPAQVAFDDELVKRFERWIRRHLREPFELARAAHAIGTSERTLQRRIRGVLGKPPIAFVQDLRLERAVHLVRTSEHSIDEIATAVGYEDGSTLRTLLRRKLRTGVRDLRRPVTAGSLRRLAT